MSCSPDSSPVASDDYTSAGDSLEQELTAADLPKVLEDSAPAASSGGPCGYDDAQCTVSMRTLAACMDGHPFPPGTRQDRQFSAPAATTRFHAVPGSSRLGLPANQHNHGADDTDGDTDGSPAVTPNRRQYLIPPPPPARRRRRSSWAAGVWPVLPHENPASGLEALSPDDLYRQFVSIRDAVLKKVGTSGQPGDQHPDGDPAVPGGGGGKEGDPGVGTDGSRQPKSTSGCAAVLPPTAHASYQRPRSDYPVFISEGGTPPHGPHRLSNTSFATDRRYGVGTKAAAAPQSAMDCPLYDPDGAEGCRQSRSPRWERATAPGPLLRGIGLPPLVIETPAGAERPERQQQSPEVNIDLQQYYYSPAASSCCSGEKPHSPFEGAVTYATDCVAYNALFAGPGFKSQPVDERVGCSSAGGQQQQQQQQLQQHESEVRLPGRTGPPLIAAFRMEASGSMPRTESLFSLQPSGEPQPSIGQAGSNDLCEQPQQPSSPPPLGQQEPACPPVDLPLPVSGGRPFTTIVRPERTSSGSVMLTVREVSEVSCPDTCRGPRESGTGTARSRLSSASGLHDPDTQGADTGTGQGSNKAAPSTDYMEALRSVAHRMLLPLPGMAAAGGVRRGGAGSLDGLSTGSTGGSAGGATAASGAWTPYASYVPLPLPCMQPSGASGSAQPFLPPLHSAPSVISATTAVLRKCLDKGIPFAVLPAEHFAGMIAAAEQHDGPLAYHILTTHCIFYPGPSRQAASSGGGAGGGGMAKVAPATGAGSGSNSTSKRTEKAAGDAAAAVQGLLAEGKPLHVMSPCEHQRLLMGVQYSVRQLHDMLVAQPEVATAAAAATVTAAGLGSMGAPFAATLDAGTAASAASAAVSTPPLPPPKPPTGGRLVLPSLPALPTGPAAVSKAAARSHRRGYSIGSDGSFTNMARFQSLGGGSAPDVAGGCTGRHVHSVSMSPSPLGPASAPGSTTASSPVAVPKQQQQQPFPAPHLPQPSLNLKDPAARLRALIQAAQLGNLCRVAYLVEHGADVNATDASLSNTGGSTHSHHHSSATAAMLGAALVGALVSGGSSGSAAVGRTPLHYAAEAGSFGVVQLLLHYGAFVGMRDAAGRTAQELARRKGHLAVAQLLKDAAERRRDVVRSCEAGESRACPAAAPSPRPRLSVSGAKQTTGGDAGYSGGGASVVTGQGNSGPLPTARPDGAVDAVGGGAAESGRETPDSTQRLSFSSNGRTDSDLSSCRTTKPPTPRSLPAGTAAAATEAGSVFVKLQQEGATTEIVVELEDRRATPASWVTSVPASTINTKELSVVLESGEVQQLGRRGRKAGGLFACFLCGS